MIRFIFIFLLVWCIGLVQFITPPTKSDTKTQAVVVLTGGANRIEEGLRILKKYNIPKLFISGVHEDVMVHELTTDTSLHNRIYLGYKATTTRENAYEIQEWLKQHTIQTIRLVTAHYHMKRSLLECQRIMPHVTIVPHVVIPSLFKKEWWTSSKALSLVVNEYHKFLLVHLRLYVNKFVSI